MNDELKIYELSLIWKEAEYNFAFWDKFDKSFDWNEEYKKALRRVLKTRNKYEYYKELSRFLSLLKDGHTGIIFPEEFYRFEKHAAKLPVKIDYIDGKYVIINVQKVVKEKVKRFGIIKKMDGIDIDRYIEENIYPYIWHEKKDSAFTEVNCFLINGEKTQADLTFEYDNNEYTVKLTRIKGEGEWAYDKIESKEIPSTIAYASASHTIKFTEDNIALIIIDTMMNDNLPKEFFENYDILKKAKGYILDIRNNGGGNSNNAMALAAMFIGNEFTMFNVYHPVHVAPYKAWGIAEGFDKMSKEEFRRNHPDDEFMAKLYLNANHRCFHHPQSEMYKTAIPGKLEGPVVILSSCKTASAAEDFINVMRYHTNVKIIGKASFGSTGQPLYYPLESGGAFRICTRKELSLDGSEFINIGFKPDIECEQSLDDYINGIDRVMITALEEIRKRILS